MRTYVKDRAAPVEATAIRTSATRFQRMLHETQGSLPRLAQSALHAISTQLRAIGSEIKHIEAQILDGHRADATSRRLATIPGIGPITASAIAATVPDASLFRSGRQFAAWLGAHAARPQ